MSLNFSMLNGIFSLITDFVTGIFAFIPQMMYFIYTCGASVIDFLQYVMRKLAGLDVYYVNGEAQEGDLFLSIVKGILGIDTDTSASYSVLSTVFWSMIIFGVVILVLSTIIKMIITHYNYNPDESHPMTILRGAIKSLFTIALVPVVTIFGIEISNALLKVLDQITAGSSNVTIAAVYKNSKMDYKSVFKSGKDSWGNDAYSSYDFFGSVAYTNSVSISGTLFTIAGNSANRIRHQSFTAHENGNGDQWSNFGIFTSNASSADVRTEEVAYMVDYAFANCLTLQTRHTASIFAGWESATLISSFSYLHSAVWYLGTINFKTFSKFNVGLVWYYYNLWGFNWFIAIAGLSIALTLIINIVFGLITRLIMALALFLIFPGVVGIKPIDGGNAQTQWRQEFVGYVLMAYGAIIGMNLVFMVLPILQSITFFGGSIISTMRSIPDLILDMVLIIAALLTTKKIIQTFSSIIGAKDAQAEGAETKEAAQKAAFAAADKTMKAAKLGIKVGKAIASGGASLAVDAAKLIAKKVAIKEAKKKIAAQLKKKLQEKLKKKNKEDAEEQKKNDEKENEDVKDATEAQAAEATENNESQDDVAEENSAEDDIVDKAEELRGNLDKSDLFANNRLSKDSFGDEFENAQEVKNWYRGEAFKQEESIKQRSDLTDEQKKEKISEMKENLKDRAMEKFFFNSSYVDKEAKSEVKETARKKFDQKTNGSKGKVKAKEDKGKGKKKDGAIKKYFKGNGKAIADVMASSLTAFGEISGLSGFKKSLEDAKVLDSTYSTIREFGQAIGMAADNLPKDDETKAKEEQAKGVAESTNVQKVNVYSERVTRQMKEMLNLLESMKK